MTLTQLEYFCAVCRYHSITRAAEALFVSQPTISTSIRDLEKEMQITIFTRTNKGVIVSTEGEIFLGYARQVLEQAAGSFLADIRAKFHDTAGLQMIGPVNAPVYRVNDVYRKILYFKTANCDIIRTLGRMAEIKAHSAEWSRLTIQFDIM